MPVRPPAIVLPFYRRQTSLLLIGAEPSPLQSFDWRKGENATPSHAGDFLPQNPKHSLYAEYFYSFKA
jgi:hypothetical protein